jgi:hypothetical protein
MLAAPIVYGLLCATIAQFIAFLMTGAGHGWVYPFFLSPWLFLLYPAAFVRFGQKQSANPLPDVALLLIAAVLDLKLYDNMTTAERAYYGRPGVVSYLWLAFWCIWQAVVLWTLCRRLFSLRKA